MNYSGFNTTITITPIVAPVNDDSPETLGTPITQRAKVTQIDGQRYVKDEEMRDKVFYKIETWANGFDSNIKITYRTLTLSPVRPITKNKDNGSSLDVVTIIAACKV